MKTNKFRSAFALVIIGLLISIIHISGCDSTKGSNITSPSSNSLTISASPTTIAADGADQSIITVTLTSSQSGAVSLTTTLGTLSDELVAVNSSGEAEVTLTSSTAGIATVRATSGTLSASTTVTIGLGSITITEASDPVADTLTTTTDDVSIEFLVKDVNGNTISGLAVTLATPTTNNSDITASWSDSSPDTNSSGVASSFLTTNSKDIGIDLLVTYTAEATGAGSVTGQVTFSKDP